MFLIQLLQYSFIQKTFISCIFIAITCSILGIFLVLRKLSLIGDGLSHVSFASIALGLFLDFYPFYITLPTVVLASILILKISKKTRLYGDASIGIVSAISIACGVILANISQGFNNNLFSYLFGNILAISYNETIFSVALSFIIISIVSFYYWDLFSVTFDEDYAKTIGIKTNFINYLLIVLTAVTVVLSIKVVGVMLVTALLILPAVTTLQISRRFKTAIFSAPAIAVSSVILGIYYLFFA